MTKYNVMVMTGSGAGSWVKAYGPVDYNTAQWFASNQSKPTQVVPAQLNVVILTGRLFFETTTFFREKTLNNNYQIRPMIYGLNDEIRQLNNNFDSTKK